ncbi:tetratricopeptide repeat protein [Methanobrevibacter sp.]|uniref:tetratricopeptide repeat protein n=1 Tax=Methanobrevibacter sp. TaxID=66852 RepID=UPI002E799189|nr:tetratricopeptide repeat protein [Methanobrevibacter sp.]MEE0939843.1 tetratricopeptide repeat protein [Methanobrevibacter sp.]
MKSNNDYLDIDPNQKDGSDNTRQTTFKISKTLKVDNLISNEKYDDALSEINRILKTDANYSNWNLKAIILAKLKRYEESVECFDKALSLNPSDEIKLNKANSIYNWAKVTFFPEGNYEKALRLIDDALNIIPDSEDPSEFYFLKAEILEALNDLAESQKAYLIAYKEFDKLKELENQIEYLNNTSDTLIIITGSYFYNFTPEKDIMINLVKQDDNEHDPDAIAVMLNDELIGYVANSPYTLIDEVKSASDIKKLINDNQNAKILFNYLGEYTIAKLV